MTRDDAQLKIRLPLPLKAKIAAAASAASRSVNAEVVARLERSFETGGYSSAKRDEIRTLVEEILAERSKRKK